MHNMRLIPVAGPAIDHIEVDAQARALIGGSTDCTVCIKDAAISRRHALIEHRDLLNIGP